MPTSMSLPEKVLDYVQVTAHALEKAAADQTAAETQRAKIAELIPKAVDALVAGERITEGQKKAAADRLADPVKALELLIKVAAHRNAGEQSLGQPHSEKSAGAGKPATDSLTSPHVGAVTSMEKQSDAALFKGLGIRRA